MPLYRTIPSQPFTGRLPSPAAIGPSDLRPSSSTAYPAQAALDRHYFRQLAGPDDPPMKQLLANAEDKLTALQDDDDVQGSGIFDPPGTQANIHPDAGVFAARYSLPGYMVRERPFKPSEVVDVTTGRPVTYVPDGSVAMDSAAQVAFLERGAFAAPRPVIQALEDRPTPKRSTVDVRVNPVPIATDGLGFVGGASTTTLLTAALVGAIAGAGLAIFRHK